MFSANENSTLKCFEKQVCKTFKSLFSMFVNIGPITTLLQTISKVRNAYWECQQAQNKIIIYTAYTFNLGKINTCRKTIVNCTFFNITCNYNLDLVIHSYFPTMKNRSPSLTDLNGPQSKDGDKVMIV